jgi:hypothetical protein
METNNILNLLDSLHKNIYGGTADKKEVSKRRAKNKLARKQRKLNKKK